MHAKKAQFEKDGPDTLFSTPDFGHSMLPLLLRSQTSTLSQAFADGHRGLQIVHCAVDPPGNHTLKQRITLAAWSLTAGRDPAQPSGQRLRLCPYSLQLLHLADPLPELGGAVCC